MHSLLTIAAAVVLSLMLPAAAVAATPAQQLAQSQAALDKAVAAHDAAQRKLDKLEDRAAKSSANLDKLVEEQNAAEQVLASRANNLYRAGQASFVTVLMNADSYEGFSARWALLTRITEQDAQAVADVKTARRKANRAAVELLGLQERAASQMRGLASAEAQARKQFAKSKAQYASYQTRVTRNQKRTTATPSPEVSPKPVSKKTGSGEWSTGVASHYGRNFRGRGADGNRIGPDSMIVAHKTLPFGTLVEFRYGGKTAVARVADRGPFTKGRMWDLGPGVIRILGFNGVHKVQYRVIGR